MDIVLYFVISICKNLTDTSNRKHLSQPLHDTNVVYIYRCNQCPSTD